MNKKLKKKRILFIYRSTYLTGKKKKKNSWCTKKKRLKLSSYIRLIKTELVY